MTEIPAFLLDNPSPPTQPSEILLPLRIGIGPVWSHDEQNGGWYAKLVIPPQQDPWWECGHMHATEGDAWDCAQEMAKEVAVRTLGIRGSRGDD